jgi:hypothetical protein
VSIPPPEAGLPARFCDSDCRDVYRARRRWGKAYRPWPDGRCAACAVQLTGLLTANGQPILIAVVRAIRRAYDRPRSEDVLRDLRWFPLEGCYGFSWGTMFVGVETDGYIHT